MEYCTWFFHITTCHCISGLDVKFQRSFKSEVLFTCITIITPMQCIIMRFQKLSCAEYFFTFVALIDGLSWFTINPTLLSLVSMFLTKTLVAQITFPVNIWSNLRMMIFFKYRRYFNRRTCLSVCLCVLQKKLVKRFGDYCLHSGTFYDRVVLVTSPRRESPRVKQIYA